MQFANGIGLVFLLRAFLSFENFVGVLGRAFKKGFGGKGVEVRGTVFPKV